MEEAVTVGANEKVAADLDEASEAVDGAAVVLIFGSSIVLGLLTAAAVPALEGGKPKVDDAAVEVEGFSVGLSEAEPVAVEGAPKRSGVAVEVAAARVVPDVADSGEALDPLAMRADCCLSLIFDIAAASRSCFSHLEYDFVFCNLGLSAAGDAGGWYTEEMRRVDKAGGGGKTATRKPAFVAADCLSGPLLTGLSREEIVDAHNRFFPATFEGDSGTSTGPCSSGGVGDESCHASS